MKRTRVEALIHLGARIDHMCPAAEVREHSAMATVGEKLPSPPVTCATPLPAKLWYDPLSKKRTGPCVT